LFDKNNLAKNKKTSSAKQRKKIFSIQWKKAKSFLKSAEKEYKKADYEKAVLHLLGSESLSFVLHHSLPPRDNLAYPSFRLFISIKKIDSEVYENSIKLFHIKNLNKKKVLEKFEIAYKIMNKCYKNKYPKERNLGFFDSLKIKYNLEGLKSTFEEYPPEFALRFIISCIIDWSLDSKDLWTIKKNKKYKKGLITLAKQILGIKTFNQKFAQEKLVLSQVLARKVK